VSGEVILLVVVLSLLAATALLAAYLTAHRLDRLHIRTDLARAALVGALERRHTVTAAVIVDLADRDPGAARRLSRALALARAHPPDAVAGDDPAPEPDSRGWRPSRDPGDDEAAEAELAENTLGVLLTGLDETVLPDHLAAELVDVTDRVSMARSFYNDAVRDTRSLREKTTVRALRLAGRAPMPDYVELGDHPPVGG
jgi:hypothetical protein